MNLLPNDKDGCPYLILAPMEGVGDSAFLKTMAAIGGFDEAVRYFLRVPSNAHVKSLSKAYNPHEIAPYPLTCQLMGSDPHLMASMATEIEKRGAPRIDLNAGCPSNTVNGRGAGSSLLKNPDLLYRVVKSLVSSVSIPVSVKMRAGYRDISLFKENLMAVEESGAKYVTVHPRTKADGYREKAQWELIKEAKSIVKIAVVGNGDIFCSEDALKMLKETGCDALMIGRGSLINPFIFHQIRAHFSKKGGEENSCHFLNVYLSHIPLEMPKRIKVNKIKQLLSYLFLRTPRLLGCREDILKSVHSNPESLVALATKHLNDVYPK